MFGSYGGGIVQERRTDLDHEQVGSAVWDPPEVRLETFDKVVSVESAQGACSMLAPQRRWHLDPCKRGDEERPEFLDMFTASLVGVELDQGRRVREGVQPRPSET
jgi:hypothetical protein